MSSINILQKHLLCIFIFSLLYQFAAFHCGTDDEKVIHQSFYDTLYFSLVTHFTVGFGDISPKSKTLKTLTMVHIVAAFYLTIT